MWANARALRTIATAVSTWAGTRRSSHPPSTAPTGRAMRKRSSTSAASSWDSRWTVRRAKNGMSTSAAMRLAPTKNDTTSAPQAGRDPRAPRGTSGRGAVRWRHQNPAKAAAASGSSQGALGEIAALSGSAEANATMTAPRPTVSISAPRRSVSRPRPAQPRQSSSGRRAVASRTRNSAARPNVVRAIGVSHRDSPTTGRKARPLVTPVTSASGSSITRARPARASSPRPSPTTSRRVAGALIRRVRPGRRRYSVAHPHHRGGEHESDRAVQPEDVAPRPEREDDRSVERPDDAAELLYRADDPERQAATRRRPQVGHQGEGRRDETAAADALDEPAGDDAGQVVRRGRDDRADREHDEAAEQDGDASAQVGDASDERQHGDVAEQEAGHDRRGPLELVEVEPDRGHHVGQRQHDDVGVGGREHDRDRREPEQDPGRGLPHRPYGTLIVTGSSEVVIFTV